MSKMKFLDPLEAEKFEKQKCIAGQLVCSKRRNSLGYSKPVVGIGKWEEDSLVQSSNPKLHVFMTKI